MLAVRIARGCARAAVFACTVWGFAAWPAAAQPARDSNQSEYERLVQSATQEFDLGNFGEAHALLERAHQLSPNARTFRGLGLASFELRHYTRAILELEAALSDVRKPLTEAQRQDVQALLKRAKLYVATIRLELSPPQAKVWFDGQPADGRELSVDPGQHRLNVRAEGFREVELPLNIDGGETKDVRVSLQRAESAGGQPPSAAATKAASLRAETSAPSGSIAPYAVIVISGVAAASGGVLMALSIADSNRVEHAAKGTTWADIKGAYERAPVLMTVGAVLLGVGVAGVATGLVWKLSSPGTESAPALTLSVGAPAIELRGTF